MPRYLGLISNMIRFYLLAFCTIFTTQVFAEIRNYGSFVYNPDHPNALFFLDNINHSDSFELRKALRNHPIDTLVLASPGGSVWEGLSMAGIIFDKKLNVFVPKGAVCASACSFMFFGGRERLAEGRLGVHQFVSSDGSRVQKKETTQAVSQFTVSEIIGFLNEFNTPRFVLERMFQDREMYWFSGVEKVELNSKVFSIEPADVLKLTDYVSVELKKRNIKQDEKPSLTKKDIVQLIQKRLNKIGCNAGYADGIWGRKTEAAAVRFARKAGLPTSVDQLISEQFVQKLTEAPNSFCPKPKYVGVQSFASAYVAYCSGKKVNDFMDIVSVDLSRSTFRWQNRRVGKKSRASVKWKGNTYEQRNGSKGRFKFNKNGYVYEFHFSNKYCKDGVLKPE